MDYQKQYNTKMQAQRGATGMGWFSIALGLTEIFGARSLARGMGMQGEEGLLRFYGLREVATGIGLLTTKNQAPWMWGRVAGDAVDIATLLAQFNRSPRKGGLVTALVAVLGATATDVVVAQQLSAQKEVERAPVRDYSDRSGFPRGADAVRGIAAQDFQAPRDMRVPEAMRSRLH